MASANSARPGVTRQHNPGHNPHLAPIPRQLTADQNRKSLTLWISQIDLSAKWDLNSMAKIWMEAVFLEKRPPIRMGWQTCCSYLGGKYVTWALFDQNQACNNFNCILILMSVWHATVHQHPVRAEADIIARCYAPTNSRKSDKVAHSVVESLRGVQTNAQMLRVNGLQHVPGPWWPSSEAWLWITQLVLRGRADPFEPPESPESLVATHRWPKHWRKVANGDGWKLSFVVTFKANLLQYLHTHHSETKLVSWRNQWCFAKHCCRRSC